jgi:ribosomal protein S18 acetylase RimI-like enzyme
MEQITTREARACDAERIVEMIAHLAQHHDDLAQIEVEDLVFLCFGPTPWLKLIVAEREEQIVGYAALQKKVQLQFARRLMDVQHLFVDAAMRGQGVGRALMQSAAEHAALHRCAGLTLGVMAHNLHAQGFYREIGFEERETGGAIQMMRALPLQCAHSNP